MSSILKNSKEQDHLEEKLNFSSHFVGAISAVVFIVLMLIKSNSTAALISSLIYGISMLLSFGTSSAYHIIKDERKKYILRIFDHSAIFLLIAGSYTPMAILKLSDHGYTLLIIEWIIAFTGIGLKVFFTGRFQVVSVILYLLMGWIIAFQFEAMKSFLNQEAIEFIIYGGLSYTVGVVFYSLKKIRFTHFIWHLFVLAGAVFHFAANYFWVIS